MCALNISDGRIHVTTELEIQLSTNVKDLQVIRFSLSQQTVVSIPLGKRCGWHGVTCPVLPVSR